MPAVPDLDDDNLQQTGGAEQEITEAGMEAWLTSVNTLTSACRRGKRVLFGAKRDELIRRSRRST